MGLVSVRGEDILTSSSEQQQKYHRLRASLPSKLWKWKTVCGWFWKGQKEHINVLELRAVLASVRWRTVIRNSRPIQSGGIWSIAWWSFMLWPGGGPPPEKCGDPFFEQMPTCLHVETRWYGLMSIPKKTQPTNLVGALLGRNGQSNQEAFRGPHAARKDTSSKKIRESKKSYRSR